MTFLELAQLVLEQTNEPMTPREIWNYALEHKMEQQMNSYGKTPTHTLNAQLGSIVKSDPGKPFFRTEDKPYRYFLSSTPLVVDQKEANGNSTETTEVKVDAQKHSYNERALHPLLSHFVYHDPRFQCLTKTIYQEKSTKGTKGENEWFHPDLVGFYFPFKQFDKVTLEVLRYFNENQFKLFSFEMKKEVTFGNLREYYFQAVSNSSWANEGYLVAVEFSSDPGFQEELARLNRAFGIGVIQLDPDNVEKSSVLFPARENKIDWTTVNRLVDKNPDFESFLRDVVGDIKAEKYHKDGYDKVYSAKDLDAYMIKEGIKSAS